MNTEKLEVDHLRENIALFRNLKPENRQTGVTALHKVGHVILYHHFRMKHGEVSVDEEDSIEDDLSYMSLHNTNDPERFLLIALGGVMMEQLVTKSIVSAGDSTDEDIEKAMLLIRIQNRMNQKMNIEDDDLSFVISANQVGSILLKYQEEAGLLLQLLMQKKRMSYDEVAFQVNQNKNKTQL